MSMQIVGLSTASPDHVLSQDNAVEMLQRLCCETPKQAKIADHLIRRTGVTQRNTCVPHSRAYDWEDQPSGPTLAERMDLYEQHAAPLAIQAGRGALEDADIDPGRVTHLVTVSCTGFEAPGVDIQLIESLGLPLEVQRVHVGFMGCHAAINGLRVAQGLVAGNKNATVLLVATELCSLHYAYGWKPEQFVSNAIFGDGSAAVVGVPGPADADNADSCAWRLTATGSRIFADSQNLMSWRVRDNGFEMTLSSELPGVIENELSGWLTTWLQRQGHSLDQVGSWAVHPGGPRIVTAVENALGLSSSATSTSREVLETHGNMSSPTILFILERMRASQAPGPCVAIGFGPGIAAEVAVFE
ncbi:type III polyketide synthase [Aeoliella sp.]|uniref:type III polyketide synthase n=1 Tax=Aeoliella sp. TaxID=2795800 RepID=UPI003CCBF52C